MTVRKTKRNGGMTPRAFVPFLLRACFALLAFGAASPASGATHFVAPDGDDAAPGTRAEPFATLARAQEEAAPGDTVYLRGGTYKMAAEQAAHRGKLAARVIALDRSGEPGRPIRYWASEGETPVFDFSGVEPGGRRVHAFSVGGSWLHLRGIEVTGVRAAKLPHTQSICFENNGSHNIYERLSMHDNEAIGIYSVRGSDNLFLNCDAYRNHDRTSGDGRGGNVDGFGCHPTRGGRNNVFRGCRAWFNSDDGFDCISAHEAVRFENCWAFYNGYSPEFDSLADGHGFKAGGYGSKPAARLPEAIPRHVVVDCLAVRNKTAGFYANHHPGGIDWIGNRAWRNGANYNMLCRQLDNRTDVPGYGHRLWNNIGHGSRRELIQIDRDRCELRANHFGTLRDDDFLSLNEALLLRPRRPDGRLPDIDLLKLRADRPASEK